MQKITLIQHILRVSHQVGIWERAHIQNPQLPKAYQGHGWKMEDGILQPVWYEGHIIPQKLADIAMDMKDSDDNADSDIDEFVNFHPEFFGTVSDNESDSEDDID